MIIEYFRPENKEDAITLLSRKTPKTLPLGGGTVLSHANDGEDLAVVDLQSLGMKEIERNGAVLRIGANTTLQNLMESPTISVAIRDSLSLECNFNLRQASTVGGAVASATGKSAFIALLMAMETCILWEPGNKTVSITDFHSKIRMKEPGYISALTISLELKTAISTISRTPESEPLICLCGSRKKDGMIRITMIHLEGDLPRLVFSGKIEKPEELAKSFSCKWNYSQNMSADYQETVLFELIKRIFSKLEQGD